MEISFNQAVLDSRLRQSFIDSIDLGESREYARDVIYIHHPHERRPSKNFLMSTKPSRLQRLLKIKHQRSDILVFASSFKAITTHDDFLSALIDHEGFHAKDFFNSPKLYLSNYCLIEEDTKKSEMEIRALQNQLNQYETGKREISPAMLDLIRRELDYQHSRVEGNLVLAKEY